MKSQKDIIHREHTVNPVSSTFQIGGYSTTKTDLKIIVTETDTKNRLQRTCAEERDNDFFSVSD